MLDLVALFALPHHLSPTLVCAPALQAQVSPVPLAFGLLGLPAHGATAFQTVRIVLATLGDFVVHQIDQLQIA